jgi:hypothetical protein
MNDLLRDLAPQFPEILLDDKLKKKKNADLTRGSKLLKYPITKKVLFLYIILIFISGLEAVLILTQTIFANQTVSLIP